MDTVFELMVFMGCYFWGGWDFRGKSEVGVGGFEKKFAFFLSSFLIIWPLLGK